MTESELKSKLQTIAANNYHTAEDDDTYHLVQQMLSHIGTVDPVLRDDLIYTTIYHWLIKQDLFDNAQRHHLWTTIISHDHLLYKLGEADTDSIFRRAFSILWLPLLLICHRQRPFLSPADIHTTQTNLIHYLHQERDWRGTVTGKGWAHGLAHAADALEDLALCSELNATHLQALLDAIHHAITTPPIMLAHEEDERFVTPIIAILNRDLLSDAAWQTWIGRFQTVAQSKEARLPNPGYGNIKHFLRSLYFRLHHQQQAPQLQAALLQTLTQINPYTPTKT